MSNSHNGFGSTKRSGSQSDDPPKKNSPDDRSATAKAATWVSRIMTISLEMVVPGLVGYWLDLKLGTKFVLMLVGFVFGVTVAIKHLLHLTQNKNPTSNTTNSDSKTSDFKT